jgi:hypothetical protein
MKTRTDGSAEPPRRIQTGSWEDGRYSVDYRLHRYRPQGLSLLPDFPIRLSWSECAAFLASCLLQAARQFAIIT